MEKEPNRKHGIIDGLDADLRDEVEQIIISRKMTYAEIVRFLAERDVAISSSSICRYAKGLNKNLQMLAVAQENFRRMMEEIDKYPALDTTEAILRLTSQHLFQALANTSEEDWQDMALDKMLRETNGLIRAAAYKKRIEIQNQESLDNGLDAVKAMVFEAMAKERPDLYKEVSGFLASKKQQGF